MAVIPEPSAQQYADTAANSPLADFGFMAKYPAVATKLAQDIGGQTGADVSGPQGVATVMHSKTYADKLNAIKSGTDDRLIKRVLNVTPNPLEPGRTGNQQEMDVYAGQEQNTLNQIRAGGVLAAQKMAAQKKLSELSSFDRASYTSQRLQELNPTADIDAKMLDLRMQAIVAKSALRNELRALSPALRDQALNARMSVFNDAISTLSDIRSARLDSAKAKIDEEASAKQEQISTAKANVSSLDDVIKTLEAQGAGNDTIYKIRLERAKAQKTLDKAGAKGGVPDEEATIVNYLLNNLVKSGQTPTSTDIAEAKRQAKEVIAAQKNPRITGPIGPIGLPTKKGSNSVQDQIDSVLPSQ